jgi:aryl-alcohol dehydrogenase-like predicted oxidoreductase
MGRFIRRWMTDEVLEAVQRLRIVADEVGLTLAQIALAWVLREPNVTSAIIGASRPSQLEENCAASGRKLDPDVLAAIDKAVAEVVER